MSYRFVESKPGDSCSQCVLRGKPRCRDAKCGGTMPHHARADGKNGHFEAVPRKRKPASTARISDVLNKLFTEDVVADIRVFPQRGIRFTLDEVKLINKLKKGKA